MISVAVISNGCEVDWSAGQRVASSLAGSWQVTELVSHGEMSREGDENGEFLPCWRILRVVL